MTHIEIIVETFIYNYESIKRKEYEQFKDIINRGGNSAEYGHRTDNEILRDELIILLKKLN